MEKGRTFGSYFLFLIREGLYRLRRELWGLRGLLALFIVFYLVIDLFGAMESERTTMGQGIAAVWMVLLFPPRMGKLLYLLPFSKKERSHYLKMYLITYLVFLVFIFLMIGVGACLITGYSYLGWLKFFVFSTVPFLLMYSGVMVYAVAVQKEPKDANCWVTPFYNTSGEHPETNALFGNRTEEEKGKQLRKKKRSELTDEEWQIRKKELRVNIISIIAGSAVIFQAYFGPIFMENNWLQSSIFWIGAGLAYAGAIVAIGVYWDIALEQIYKKGSTGKEESVCNL